MYKDNKNSKKQKWGEIHKSKEHFKIERNTEKNKTMKLGREKK